MNKYLGQRSRLMFSLAAGISVAILVWSYLRRAEEQLNARYEMTTVLVAKKYISIGKEIKPELFEEKKIPVAFLEPTAVTRWESLKSNLAKAKIKTRIGILKGEQITESKLMEEGRFQSLAWTLPPDQTAVTLRLSAEQAVGGHLRPGDWVTVFATFDVQPGVREPETVTILPRCQVVGLQDHLWDPSGSFSEKMDWKDLSNDLILVTLSVNSDQMGCLTLASAKGQVWLSLQSALQSSPSQKLRIRMSQMLKS